MKKERTVNSERVISNEDIPKSHWSIRTASSPYIQFLSLLLRLMVGQKTTIHTCKDAKLPVSRKCGKIKWQKCRAHERTVWLLVGMKPSTFKSLHCCSSRALVLIVSKWTGWKIRTNPCPRFKKTELCRCFRSVSWWMKHLNFIHKIKRLENFHINNLLPNKILSEFKPLQGNMTTSTHCAFMELPSTCVPALVQYHN